ncbi:MAG: Rab family GTPase [Methanobacteriota archaeon]
MVADTKTYKVKICLVGEEGVGKTSLIHRFVSGAFDESYIRTLGAVVSKKSVALGTFEGRPVHVDMMILDIMGKRTFLQLFKDAYFNGAKGILAVFDTTRKASVKDLTAWIDGVRDSVGPIPVYVLGNKIDLNGRKETNDDDVRTVLGAYEAPVLYTSAKTGVNVEEAFQGLAKTIVENAVS